MCSSDLCSCLDVNCFNCVSSVVADSASVQQDTCKSCGSNTFLYDNGCFTTCPGDLIKDDPAKDKGRSEERRVGKECRSRGSAGH